MCTFISLMNQNFTSINHPAEVTGALPAEQAHAPLTLLDC